MTPYPNVPPLLCPYCREDLSRFDVFYHFLRNHAMNGTNYTLGPHDERFWRDAYMHACNMIYEFRRELRAASSSQPPSHHDPIIRESFPSSIPGTAPGSPLTTR